MDDGRDGVAQRLDGGGGIGRVEDRRAGDEDPRPRVAVLGAVSVSMPPSTSIETARPRESMAARASAIFGTTSSMNAWPGNPGKTVMQSRRSITPRYGSTSDRGVSGLRASPTRMPRSRIAAARRAVRPISTWTVTRSTPASANPSSRSSGFVTMRWQSKNAVLWRRNEATTGGPIVRFGTKCPSITSTCSQSVTVATSPAAAARAP